MGAPTEKDAVEIAAESDKKKDDTKTKKNGKKPDDDADDNLSEEDKELKERLETCVSTCVNKENESAVTIPIRLKALDVIVTELRTATSSMTSVPKPLKFLRPHFSSLKELYTTIQKMDSNDNDALELRARLADVLAVLAMTMGKPEERESLKFKLSGAKDYDLLETRGAKSKNAEDNLGSWGHEFIRSLAGEIGQEYSARVLDGADPDQDEPFADLLRMVDVIVPFHVTHNAEAEAVDLLIEVQRLKNLLKLDTIDEHNYQRICLYLVKTADYMDDPDDLVVSNSHRLLGAWPFALTTLFLTLVPSPICRKCLKLHTKSSGSKDNTTMPFGLLSVCLAKNPSRNCLRNAQTH